MNSEKHKVLVVGAGSIGERHLRCFEATGRAQTGFCELNEEVRSSVAKRCPTARCYSELNDAIQDSWDAAVIATPADTHIPIARQLAAQGLHLLIEKPLSTSIVGAEDLRTFCREKKRIVSIAYVHRSNPILAQMRAAIASGQFGMPLEVIACCGQHFPTFRPAYREIYYADRSKGGGAIQDALTHIINAAEWIVGPVDRVMADAQHLALPGVNVEDTVHVLTRHGKVMGCFSLNQFQSPSETILTIVCERGTVRYEPDLNRWRWMTEPNGDWNDRTLPPAERDTTFIHQANAFMDALERRAEVLCSLDEAMQTLRVNLAILKAVTADTWQSTHF